VSLYEVEVPNNEAGRVKNKNLMLRQVYQDSDKEEDFYAIAFGGRCVGTPLGFGPVSIAEEEESDTEKQPIVLETAPTRRDVLYEMTTMGSLDGPQLLCVAGSGQSIKVIDIVRRSLFFTLSGHLDEVLDLKFSPTDEWLLLSASKDQSVRLWDVKRAACVAIFAGHDAHRESVLSVAWHPLGASFVSGSVDTTIKVWDVGEGTDVHEAIQNSKTTGARLLGRPRASSAPKDHFQAVWEQAPVFSTNKVHVNYVDCVEFVGDLILSKSIDDEVVLWKPVFDTHHSGGEGSSAPRIPNEVVSLRSFRLSKAESWFVRFSTNQDSTLLACGNNVGETRVWTIDAKPKKKHFASLTNQFCTSTVRMVAFSPDSRFLVACCDDSTLFKWDAVY
jgi:polycomb protein EED